MDKNQRVYLDHAATTPVHPEVLQEMLPYFGDIFGNPSSFYQRGRDARRALENARQRVAACIGADPGEIYFTACGTESDNWAIKGTAWSKQKKGKHIITSKIEHHAVLHTCQALEKQGFEITWLPVDSDGLVDPESVRQAIRDDTILVSIMMANNEIGTVEPIEEIAKICKDTGVVFHSDAVQAAGTLSIDAHKLGIDLLSFSGHKLYGPKGTGVLYMRKGLRIDTYLDGGAQEKNRRGGTENVAGIIGLARAFEIAVENRQKNNRHLTGLRDHLIDQILDQISNVRLNGHRTKRLANNVNLSFEFIEGESILLMLDHYGYECSSGSACTSGSLDPSHVLLAIGLPHEIAHGSLRVTFGSRNTLEEVDRLVNDLKIIVQRLRDMSPLYETHLKEKSSAATASETGK